MAVVALVAVSCTTDTTQDLGVTVGNDGLTQISLSLEQSRTQLGEKAGELYPLLWSEGDQISINGVASTALSADAAGAATATFSVAGNPAKPYCIAYPAAAAGQVVFATEQTHTEGTFASGVATMYAYAADGLGVTLNHLTGVLKIGVTGSAKLVLAQISNVNRKPIAGAFDFDFEKGEATATAASKEIINYSFGEGIQLSNEPTYIHAVVPAGEYGELYVTLYDADGGVMYAAIKTDETKPLVAGKVREFSNSIVYAATDALFVVKDAASLKAFAEQAATLEKDILFVADVDMTGEAWTPIEGYAKTVRGNGYAIKGLTAPLFGTTNASIKGLHLRDVVLNSNNAPRYGAFACEVVAISEEVPVIESCSVSGTFTIENTEYIGLAHTLTNQKYSNLDSKAAEMAYGGIVGLSRGINIVDCVNNAAITVKQIAKMENDIDVVPTIGGITGNAFYVKVDGVEYNTHLTGCVNNADILYQDKSCNNETWRVIPAVGGISGGTYHHTGLTKGEKEEFATFHDCNNYGDITFQAVGGGQGQDTQGHPQTHVAGIVARGGYMGAYNCNNYGAITLDGHFKQTFSGGVCGASYYANLDNCHNFGAVTMTEKSTFWGLMIAGISGNNYNTGDFVHLTNNCSNNAPITILGSTAANATKGSYHYRVGGCEGFGRGLASNLTNNKEGVITCKGTVKMMNTNFKGCEIGGVTAYRTTRGWSASKNYADINVDLNYSMLDGVEDTNTVVDDRALYIGAIVGYTSQRTVDSENKGNVTVKGTYNCESLFVSGAVGYGNVGANTVNHGKITLDDNISVDGGRTYVGGLCGANDYGAKDITGVENHGNVYVGGSHYSIWLGGVFAHNRAGFTGAKNHGEVKLAVSQSTNGVHMGGLGANFTRFYYKEASKAITTGDAAYGFLTNCENHGEVVVALKSQITGSVNVGGVVKQGQQDMIGCVNYGNITVNGGGSVSSTYLAGLVLSNSAELREDCYNKGKITMDNYTVGSASSTGSDLFIGGICYNGGSNTPYTNCHNEGDIEIGKNVKVANCLRIGGFITNVETSGKTNVITDCSNSGDITVYATNSVNVKGVMRIGGFISQHQDGTLKLLGTIKNSGNINYAGKQAGVIGTSIGGIFGGNDSAGSIHADSYAVLLNEGTLSFTGETVQQFYIGGIAAFVSKYAIPATVKLINTGDVVATGKCGAGLEKNCIVSGIIGSLKAPIEGAQCFCTIDAYKYQAQQGMLSGKARAVGSVLYNNAKVGGKMVTKYDEDEDVYTTISLKATDYFKYLYGGTTDWTGNDAHDGCTLISSKDEIDYTVPVAPAPAE